MAERPLTISIERKPNPWSFPGLLVSPSKNSDGSSRGNRSSSAPGKINKATSYSGQTKLSSIATPRGSSTTVSFLRGLLRSESDLSLEASKIRHLEEIEARALALTSGYRHLQYIEVNGVRRYSTKTASKREQLKHKPPCKPQTTQVAGTNVIIFHQRVPRSTSVDVLPRLAGPPEKSGRLGPHTLQEDSKQVLDGARSSQLPLWELSEVAGKRSDAWKGGVSHEEATREAKLVLSAQGLQHLPSASESISGKEGTSKTSPNTPTRERCTSALSVTSSSAPSSPGRDQTPATMPHHQTPTSPGAVLRRALFMSPEESPFGRAVQRRHGANQEDWKLAPAPGSKKGERTKNMLSASNSLNTAASDTRVRARSPSADKGCFPFQQASPDLGAEATSAAVEAISPPVPKGSHMDEETAEPQVRGCGIFIEKQDSSSEHLFSNEKHEISTGQDASKAPAYSNTTADSPPGTEFRKKSTQGFCKSSNEYHKIEVQEIESLPLLPPIKTGRQSDFSANLDPLQTSPGPKHCASPRTIIACRRRSAPPQYDTEKRFPTVDLRRIQSCPVKGNEDRQGKVHSRIIFVRLPSKKDDWQPCTPKSVHRLNNISMITVEEIGSFPLPALQETRSSSVPLKEASMSPKEPSMSPKEASMSVKGTSRRLNGPSISKVPSSGSDARKLSPLFRAIKHLTELNDQLHAKTAKSAQEKRRGATEGEEEHVTRGCGSHEPDKARELSAKEKAAVERAARVQAQEDDTSSEDTSPAWFRSRKTAGLGKKTAIGEVAGASSGLRVEAMEVNSLSKVIQDNPYSPHDRAPERTPETSEESRFEEEQDLCEIEECTESSLQESREESPTRPLGEGSPEDSGHDADRESTDTLGRSSEATSQDDELGVSLSLEAELEEIDNWEDFSIPASGPPVTKPAFRKARNRFVDIPLSPVPENHPWVPDDFYAPPLNQHRQHSECSENMATPLQQPTMALRDILGSSTEGSGPCSVDMHWPQHRVRLCPTPKRPNSADAQGTKGGSRLDKSVRRVRSTPAPSNRSREKRLATSRMIGRGTDELPHTLSSSSSLFQEAQGNCISQFCRKVWQELTEPEKVDTQITRRQSAKRGRKAGGSKNKGKAKLAQGAKARSMNRPKTLDKKGRELKDQRKGEHARVTNVAAKGVTRRESERSGSSTGNVSGAINGQRREEGRGGRSEEQTSVLQSSEGGHRTDLEGGAGPAIVKTPERSASSPGFLQKKPMPKKTRRVKSSAASASSGQAKKTSGGEKAKRKKKVAVKNDVSAGVCLTMEEPQKKSAHKPKRGVSAGKQPSKVGARARRSE